MTPVTPGGSHREAEDTTISGSTGLVSAAGIRDCDMFDSMD